MIKFQTKLTEFTNYLKANGQSIVHADRVKQFLVFCELENIELNNIKYADICNFVSKCQILVQENTTINAKISSIRSFYRFLLLNTECSEETLAEINKFKMLRIPKKLHPILTTEELPKLVGICMTNIPIIHPYKTRALLYFMFYTGIRKGELINLKRENIDLEKNTAIIKLPVKRNRERFIHFPPQVSEYLKMYFAVVPEKTNAFNLTNKSIRYFIWAVNKFLDDNKKISPHSLRHSFANMLAENDINPKVAQKLLGHSHMSSTMIYYDPDAKIVEKVYRAKVEANPTSKRSNDDADRISERKGRKKRKSVEVQLPEVNQGVKIQVQE